MDIKDIIFNSIKEKKLIKDIVVNYLNEDFFLYEPYVLDSLDKLNKQIEKNYKKDSKNEIQEITFLGINKELYQSYINKDIGIEDYTTFNNSPLKVKECIILKNYVKIDPLQAKELIYSVLN